tara:strand:- start:3885 stop:4577 length:693 start_codon:yes stop_codon:yes gene_type:complete
MNPEGTSLLLEKVKEVSELNNISTFGFFINLLISLSLGLLQAFFYTRYGRSISNRKEFGSNFALLAMTTMFIITIVKSSLALSLGLVGALSIIRFRSAIKEPEELTYIFLSMAIGLGLGANQRLITIIAVVSINIFIFIRHKSKRKENNKFMNLLINFQKSADIDFDKIVEIINDFSIENNILRYTEDEQNIDACLLLDINSFTDMRNLQKKLILTFPKLSIDFVDHPDI